MAPRLLFVSHNASRSGAPRLLLGFLGWLREHTDADLTVLLLDGGPLRDDFAAVARLVEPDAAATAAVDLVYLNTVASAPAVALLADDDMPVIAHLHEQAHALADWVAVDERDRLLARTSRFITVSELARADLADLPGVDPNRIACHHGFVDGVELSGPWDGAGCRRRIGIGRDAIVVGASGTTEWRKGPDLFVDLGRRLHRAGRDVDLLWVGGSAEGPEIDPVLGDRDRLGLADRVHFVGEQANPFDWFSAMDVFVLTSRADPFPLTALEAAALRVPIVTFDSTGARELVEDGAGLVVPFPDVDALAAAVQHLLDDPAARDAMTAEAARRVTDDHDVAVAAPRLWAEIEAVLAEAGR